MQRFTLLLHVIIMFSQLPLKAQQIEKGYFNPKDSGNCYLAIPPLSGKIKGTLVLFAGFTGMQRLLGETKLHNVAFGNDMLTIFAPTYNHLYASPKAIENINTILRHAVSKYHLDTTRIAFAGFGIPGNIIIRYAELCFEKPEQFPVRPRAVIGVDCNLDLPELWRWSERQVQQNFNREDVETGKFLLGTLKEQLGMPTDNPAAYAAVTPYQRAIKSTGHEQYLKNVPVRLYYDTDIEWRINNNRQGYDDTNLPEGSDFICRLRALGNTDAAFVSAKHPGYKSNGIRTVTTLSIIDEIDCIRWLKEKMNIFDAATWVPPYTLSVPDKWGTERFDFPVEFAPGIPYKGVEDLRFAPGWGETNSPEHWSYTFLWWLEGQPVINAASIQQHLTEYYNGLVGRNIISRKIPEDKLVPLKVQITSAKTQPDDIATYTGTVYMLNYMAQTPITLNCIIHLRYCSAQQRTAAFFEISPRPYTDVIWKTMNGLWTGFSCGK
ncbi:hypothetical protein [Chitinophaga flava]|uniref:Alpha/beta hydrolase n=1 Tax=Chitinophaga flava TaxID=2259036 RepID=A0A365XXM9_9BACT|nr:hypothetical protein [Chitinophaga flava]RBL90335.1 hypothetical protein DF182_28120 [Chitinophaga flava]